MYGWPLLVHYCDSCTYNTSIEYSASVWTQEHACNHCGIKSPGADIAGQSKGAMNQTQHDELAQLFSQHMQLSQYEQQHHDQTPLIAHVSDCSEQKPDNQVHFIASPVHYISSHYTQTAHVRGETQSEPSRSPPPPYHESVMSEAMAETLRQHSIDPSALLPNQIQLFMGADYEQRLRLLELWRIAPPTYPLEEHLRSRHCDTSVELEEQAAMIRYEQQSQNRSMQPEELMLDTNSSEMSGQHSAPLTPIRGPGEDAWPPAARMRASSIAAGRHSIKIEAEPYIVNGYETNQVQRSADPVYGAAPGLWQMPSCAQIHQPPNSMAQQYGMFEQIRNHADWERRNEQMMQEQYIGLHGPMDDDMVM